MDRISAIVANLGSKRFSIGILIAGAIYFTFLTILWSLNLIPPASFMIWGPVVLWVTLFLINLTINLVTKRFAYKGNLLFHIAFIIVAIGITVSHLLRFSGEVILAEGESFFGSEKEYTKYSASSGVVPHLSFKVDKIIPGYWGNNLYFTRLDGEVRYPAETLSNSGIVRLNGGLKIDGAKIRLKGFGLFPEVLIEEKGNTLMKGHARLMVFPPGTEDALEVKSYKVYVKVFPDPKVGEGVIKNMSMNLREPLFLLRTEWFGQEIYKGALRIGETARFGDVAITFNGVKHWVEVGVVKDPGEMIIFSGFVLGVAGLGLRLCVKKGSIGP